MEQEASGNETERNTLALFSPMIKSSIRKHHGRELDLLNCADAILFSSHALMSYPPSKCPVYCNLSMKRQNISFIRRPAFWKERPIMNL